jgi:NAD(P)-dependent dehydrogenase (short-subunit alcohol dehydrogenase family)
MTLAHKVALVTGGSRGIGRAVAAALAAEGVAVVVAARDGAAAERAAAEIASASKQPAMGVAADVRDLAQVAELFRSLEDRFGGLDILINNAGIAVFAPVGELEPADFCRTIDTNLTGVFYCCHEAVPRMRRRGGGAIVNIGSLASREAFSGGAAYNASKFGLLGLTEALMLDVRYDGIRVAIVMPGSVDTEFGDRRPQDPGGTWMLLPEDVAAAVIAFLKMPERATLSKLELRPSRPPRKS